MDINLSTLPSKNLNVRADVSSSVESIRFSLNSNTNYRTENSAPFSLAGDSLGDYNSWTPAIGQLTLGATPFTGDNASGTSGTQFLVHLNVIDIAQPTTGDLDKDGDVDETDYQILVGNMGLTGNPGFIDSDIDNDGDVDIYDFSLLVSSFGQ
jgi:hypothetical protein